MDTDGDTARLAAYYDDFARRWAHGTSPLYEEWAAGVAADPSLLDRIVALPPRLRQANLLFAAARVIGAPERPYPAWAAWLAENWDDVLEIASTRSVQTNEPGRCATLLPVLSRIEGPVALLEVGAAAGLCLFPDRYGVRYPTPSGERRVNASPPGDVELRCTVDDEASGPTAMPAVVWREGIDLNPIDAGDADAVDWLAALVWPGPDHDDRVARLRGAAAVVAAAPPRIHRGDLNDLIEPVAASAPVDATLVVFHSAVLLYLDDDARGRFVRTVREIADRVGRRVVWLSNETSGTVPGVADLVPPGVDAHHRFVQTVDGRPVALAGQHGAVYETLPFR